MEQKDLELKNLLKSPVNEITIYTVMKVLARMKEYLGLEAMLQYMERYSMFIEKQNPELKKTVRKAIVNLDVVNMYIEGMDK
ncbi:MAG: hypothetical protein KKD07_06460 [Candidatus Omnitrophica bacterium]|nr:hypothetical protein [Candidatus Omnitrophota bacterium]MBU1997630.1 hypothetical protein [Candidatus Omnitrophota bacterium]MBU4334066.1 hypothetical protein [Candidatus Omnitrophota bacterium]